MSAWSRRVATVADGRTGRGSDDGGGDGNVDGGSGGVNLGGAIDGIIGSRCRSASAKGGTTNNTEKSSFFFRVPFGENACCRLLAVRSRCARAARARASNRAPIRLAELHEGAT